MRKYTPEQRIAKFWSRVDKSAGEDACWIWTAAPDQYGYGRMYWRGRNYPAHRIAYEVTHGDIPDGLWVLHRCDNPPCVNPAHLFLGTRQDNVDDMMQKGRANRPSGEKRGLYLHPERQARGSRQGSAKLTDVDVIAIRRRYADGNVTKAQLGRDFGVSDVLIGLIVREKYWRHLL